MTELVALAYAGKSQDFPPKLNAANWEIRLLLLSPAADHTAPLVGSFKVVSVREHARYDAISHAWGMPGPLWLIEIDDHPYYITLSLAKCLVALRYPSEERALWVDAVCVDQRNVQERSQQVEFMQHTFSGAWCVQVWLGHKSTRCKRLIETVNDFVRQQRPSAIVSRQTKQQRIEEIDDLDLFFTEPQYWNRLWVWQELALARNIWIVYGRQSMSMDSFRTYLTSCTSVVYQGLNVVDPRDKYNAAVLRMIQLEDMTQALSGLTGLATSNKMTRLIRIFAKARKTVASDPRDRVYGLLGICTAMFGSAFMKADYAASLVDIYTTFAYRTIEISQRLDIFNQANWAMNSIIGLPSWVPDWSSFYDAFYESERLLSREGHNAFGHLRKADAKLRIQNKPIGRVSLVIKGVMYRTVIEVGMPCQPNEPQRIIQSQVMSVVQTWYQVFQQTIAYSADCDLQTFLSKRSREATQFANAMLRGKWDLPDINDGSGPPTYPCGVLRKFVQNPTTELHKQPELTHRFHQLRQAVMASRFLVITDGDIGLGPIDTQPGDVIAVLAGGRVPYVLRQADTRISGAYSLVGECYVESIMRGEPVEDLQAEYQEITLI